MKKPHEAELAVRFNGGNTCLTDDSGKIVAYVPEQEWQAFFKVAPKMARALLALMQDGHVQGWCGAPDGEECPEDSECGMVRSALKDAGVFP